METDKITSSYRVNLGEQQVVVDAKMQNGDGGNISKVLSVEAKAYIDDVEMLNGEANFLGGVVFDLLFVDETGATNLLSEKVDLHTKFQDDRINPRELPIYTIEVIDEKVTGIDGDTANVKATISVKLNAVRTDTIEKVQANAKNIEVSRENIMVANVVCNGMKTFNVAEEYETKFNVLRVLGTNAHIALKDINAGTGYFTVSGNVFVNSVLEVEGEDGKCIKNFMETVPFKEELEDEQIQKGDIVDANLYLKPEDVTLQCNTGAEGNETLEFKANVTAKYIVTRVVEMEVPTDAFSLTNKANLLSGTFMCAKPTRFEKFNATIDGQTTLNDDEARIAKICAVTNEHMLVANTTLNENELTVEGVAYMTVVYQTDDDIPEYSSVNVEIPFANKFDVDNEFYGNVFVTSQIVDIDTKVKKGKDIYVILDVCFLAYAYDTQNQVVLKDIELTEKLPPKKYALEMYVAPKGSTLWDVSKQMLVDEETLLKQNPELVFPLEQNQTIVYFRQRAN